MLRLNNITKDYKVADTTVRALRGVSLSFRKSEFVAVLGPSGCGKTTLLNIVGGLDKYTTGDLFIGGVSTKEFGDREWDVYRNHRVGFIFQSYNLIPHQTVLSNVELALTIAGMAKEERVQKAKAALEKVGLASEIYKRPNQLSGGQSQRVAIARALVNDPDILLADEPTGALDTETSRQIMDLVKEIANDRLVIMVTHNPELAAKYATRIIRLLDGELLSDTNPFSTQDEIAENRAIAAAAAVAAAPEKGKRVKKEKAKMSFWTAFKLSLNNLLTKKRRTFMTSFAGSIGIIGVSLVLSVSYGVQGYISNMQNDMLSGNPITIEERALNISAMMQSNGRNSYFDEIEWEDGKVKVSSTMANLVRRSENMSNIMQSNEITQDYIDYVLDMPKENVAAINLGYGLNLTNNIYTDFTPALRKPSVTGGVLDRGDGTPVNMSLTGIKEIYAAILRDSEFSQYESYISSLDDVFQQLIPDEKYITDQYNFVEVEGKTSKYAKEPGEVMLVLQRNSRLSDLLLAQLGYYTQNEFMNMVFRATQALEIKSGDYIKEMDKFHFEYGEILGKEFTYYPNDVVFADKNPSKFTAFTEGVVDNSLFEHRVYSKEFTQTEKDAGIKLKIVGIMEPKENLSYGTLSAGFFYTAALREKIFDIERQKTSAIVKALTSASIESFISAASPKDLIGRLSDTELRELMKEYIGDMALTIPIETLRQMLLTYLPEEMKVLGGSRTGGAGGIVFKYEYTFPYDEINTIIRKNEKGDESEIKLRSAQRLNVEGKGKTTLVKDLEEGDVIIYEKTGSDNEVITEKFTVVKIVRAEGPVRTETNVFGAVGSTSPYAGIAGMFGSIMGGMGSSTMDGVMAALNVKTLSLRELSGRNKNGQTIANYIEIYPVNFELKVKVLAYLDAWNNEEGAVEFHRPNGDLVKILRDDRADVIYQDFLSLIITMINTFISIITIALICFTSLALVVSTVMIAIITYVSVVERIKEIGVIRSLGGRKRDVSYLFNAETFIIGSISGIIGIAFTFFASWIINIIVNALVTDVTIGAIAVFPWFYAAIMLGVSIILTLISGLLPSRSAARKDPVVALRTE